jgi:autotransporter-associated beta strand protein
MYLKALVTVVALILVTACGGGGSVKPDPVVQTTCGERLATPTFATRTITNPSVSDTSCPAGETLVQAGSSFTTSTTTYSCPSNSSISNPIATTTTSAPTITQSKICRVGVTPTCAQKLGTGSFVDSVRIVSTTQNMCPENFNMVQEGLSDTATRTVYSCVDPASTADPVASIITDPPQVKRPLMCNSTASKFSYFKVQTGVPAAQAAGFNGQGVKVAVLDEGFNTNHITFAGRTTTFGALNSSDDHGTYVTSILGGTATGSYGGGIAPNVTFGIAEDDNQLDELADWGAQVFNFSFGYDLEIAGASQTQINKYILPWLSDFRYIKSKGAFIAISASNESASSVGILAGAPAVYADLTHILAVAAMNPDTGLIASYSNRCGDIAKAFCITAPGTVFLVESTVNAGDVLQASDYVGFSGTSASAPVVSGIAAMVYQAFPGFTGTQVRDTLISTATDIGDVGVDAIYGVGLVNAEKAVKGPARLSASFEAAVPLGVLWNFGNDIDGEGGIVKVGAGGLSLSGENAYLGGTIIEEGRINLYGQLGSDVWINGGSLHSFGGSIAGNIFANSGSLVLSTENVLSAKGEVYFNGGVLTLQAPLGYTTQWQGVLLSADSIIGQAQVTTTSDWLYADAQFQSSQVFAELHRKAVTDVLADYNATQLNAANNLELAFQALDAGFGSSFLQGSAAKLQSSSREQAGLALMALSGQSQTTMKSIALETAEALRPLLNARLHDISALDGQGGFWFMVANPNGTLEADGYLDVDINSTVYAAGLDYTWHDVAFGAALFTAEDRADYQQVQDRLDGDRNGITLYARQEQPSWYWQGYAVFSRYDADNRRTLNLGDVFSTAVSSSEGSHSGITLEAGWPFASGFSIALQASADWLQSDAYTESGNSGLELGFPEASFSRYLLGPDIRYRKTFANGFAWDALIGYQQVLNDVDTDMRAYYAGLPDTTFIVEGMPYPDGFLNWGLGTGYRTNNAYWYLRGDGQYSDNSDRLTLSAGVRVAF